MEKLEKKLRLKMLLEFLNAHTSNSICHLDAKLQSPGLEAQDLYYNESFYEGGPCSLLMF